MKKSKVIDIEENYESESENDVESDIELSKTEKLNLKRKMLLMN